MLEEALIMAQRESEPALVIQHLVIALFDEQQHLPKPRIQAVLASSAVKRWACSKPLPPVTSTCGDPASNRTC